MSSLNLNLFQPTEGTERVHLRGPVCKLKLVLEVFNKCHDVHISIDPSCIEEGEVTVSPAVLSILLHDGKASSSEIQTIQRHIQRSPGTGFIDQSQNTTAEVSDKTFIDISAGTDSSLSLSKVTSSDSDADVSASFLHDIKNNSKLVGHYGKVVFSDAVKDYYGLHEKTLSPMFERMSELQELINRSHGTTFELTDEETDLLKQYENHVFLQGIHELTAGSSLLDNFNAVLYDEYISPNLIGRDSYGADSSLPKYSRSDMIFTSSVPHAAASVDLRILKPSLLSLLTLRRPLTEKENQKLANGLLEVFSGVGDDIRFGPSSDTVYLTFDDLKSKKQAIKDRACSATGTMTCAGFLTSLEKKIIKIVDQLPEVNQTNIDVDVLYILSDDFKILREQFEGKDLQGSFTKNSFEKVGNRQFKIKSTAPMLNDILDHIVSIQMKYADVDEYNAMQRSVAELEKKSSVLMASSEKERLISEYGDDVLVDLGEGYFKLNEKHPFIQENQKNSKAALVSLLESVLRARVDLEREEGTLSRTLTQARINSISKFSKKMMKNPFILTPTLLTAVLLASVGIQALVRVEPEPVVETREVEKVVEVEKIVKEKTFAEKLDEAYPNFPESKVLPITEVLALKAKDIETFKKPEARIFYSEIQRLVEERKIFYRSDSASSTFIVSVDSLSQFTKIAKDGFTKIQNIIEDVPWEGNFKVLRRMKLPTGGETNAQLKGMQYITVANLETAIGRLPPDDPKTKELKEILSKLKRDLAEALKEASGGAVMPDDKALAMVLNTLATKPILYANFLTACRDENDETQFYFFVGRHDANDLFELKANSSQSN